MPAPLNLSGQRFGKLTLLEPCKLTNGSRGWLCRCDCGKTTRAHLGNLRRGGTKSCGCGRLFANKAKARAEHKARQQVEDGGECWFAPKAAARYIGLKCRRSDTTVRTWARGLRDACKELLGGEDVRTRRLSYAFGRQIEYVAKESLDRIRDAFARLQAVPDHAGLVYVGNAAATLGVSDSTLRRRLAAEGLQVQHRLGKMKKRVRTAEGRSPVRFIPCWRSYVPQAFVDRLRAGPRAVAPATREVAGIALVPGVQVENTERNPIPMYIVPAPDGPDDTATARSQAELKPKLKGRPHPSRSKHETWKAWRDAGMSYGKIRARWQEETGEEVTRDAVVKAIGRMQGSEAAQV